MVSDNTLVGIWFARPDHHDIFVQEISGRTVGVITVLHESMDLPARIKDPRSLTDLFFEISGALGHRAGSTNGATTQESPSTDRREKAITGRIMVNSRCRVQVAVATGFDILKIQTLLEPATVVLPRSWSA